jgi:cell division protein FtsW (lipid II flippase)
MHETMNVLNKIFKCILYIGAVACCLAGLWVIYVAIANFREMQFPAWIVVLAMEAVFVCLSFTPAFMFFKGWKTKTWHSVVIGIVEAIVVALVLIALYVLANLEL